MKAIYQSRAKSIIIKRACNVSAVVYGISSFTGDAANVGRVAASRWATSRRAASDALLLLVPTTITITVTITFTSTIT